MKKWTKLFQLVLCVMIISLMTSSVVLADYYWESVHETKGMQGRPDATSDVKNYLTSNAYRIEREGHIIIMNFDTMMMFHIDPSSKTYHQINITELGKSPEAKDDNGPMRQKMKNAMTMIQVTPTQETRQIAGYNCQKYLVSGMMMNSEYWLSKDVKGYDEIKEIAEKNSHIFEQNPVMRQMNIGGMMSQLDGFPVQIIMNILKGTSITTLKKIEKKTLDKSLFTVPDGYTLKENKMPMISNMHPPMSN